MRRRDLFKSVLLAGALGYAGAFGIKRRALNELVGKLPGKVRALVSSVTYNSGTMGTGVVLAGVERMRALGFRVAKVEHDRFEGVVNVKYWKPEEDFTPEDFVPQGPIVRGLPDVDADRSWCVGVEDPVEPVGHVAVTAWGGVAEALRRVDFSKRIGILGPRESS